jgi:hypothetical protein
MNEIKVELLSDIDEQSLNFSNILQTPVSAYRNYFYGDDETYKHYLEKHNILINFNNFKFLNDINSQIDNFLFDIQKAISEDISHFDARLASSPVKRASTDTLGTSDWEVVIYSLSNLNSHDRDKLKSNFFEISSPTLFDFRELIGDNLVFTQCRKAIANRNDSLKIVRSKKNAYYPTSTTRDIKGCNFITAQQTINILNTVSSNVNIIYNRNGSEVIQTKEEILTKEVSFYNNLDKENKQYSQSEATKILNELRTIQDINHQAKEEIQKDKNKNRGSLKPDSINEQLNSSRIESPTLTPLSNLTSEEEILLEFENEKTFLLLKKQKKDELLYAKAVEIQEEAIHLAHKLLNDGQSFKQINNILNQKFAQNPFVTEIVNLHISKQLKLAKVKDNEIEDLQEYIKQIQIEQQKEQEKYLAREQEISKLRSTMQKKEINHTNEIIKFQEELKKQEEITIQSLDTIKELNDYKNEMDNVIIELDNNNTTLKEKLKNSIVSHEEKQKHLDKIELLELKIQQMSDKLISTNEEMVEILKSKKRE